MGFDLGKFLTNAGTLGTTWMRDQRRAKKEARRARDLIEENTNIARDLFNRDYGASPWEDVQADPDLRAAQDDALSRLEGISRQGFTETDRDALNQAFMQSRGEEQSQRQAAMDAAARRGDASGGNALMASLAAQQGGANRAAQFATDIGVQGRDRALRGLEAYGQQAGQMRSQDFGEQGQRAAGIQGFNQWATGQRSQDAQMLMNAQTGQAQSMQQHAAQLQASPAADIALQAGAAYLSGGTSALGGLGSGKAAASTANTGVGTTGAGSLSTSGTIDPVTGLAKSRPGPQQKGMPQAQNQQVDLGNVVSQAANGTYGQPIQARRQRRSA